MAGRRMPELLALPLNELGDFLAGAFGPLAVFWLVLGYYQQARELRISSSALVAQCVELSNSVEQQRKALKLSMEQAEIARKKHESELLQVEESLRPWLDIVYINSGVGSGSEWFNFEVMVSNADAKSLKVERVDGGVAYSEVTASLMAAKSKKSFQVMFDQEELPESFELAAYCTNSRGKNYGYHFTFTTSGRGKLSAHKPSITKID